MGFTGSWQFINKLVLFSYPVAHRMAKINLSGYAVYSTGHNL